MVVAGMKTEKLLLFAGRRKDFPSRKARIAAAAEPPLQTGWESGIR
jgi:hypothetical protein